MGQYADEEAFNPQLASELGGTVIKLTFTGHSTHQPIVGELTLRYGLPFNILHGKMTQTAHGVSLPAVAARGGVGRATQ